MSLLLHVCTCTMYMSACLLRVVIGYSLNVVIFAYGVIGLQLGPPYLMYF